MSTEIRIYPSFKKKFYVYYSLYSPIDDETQPKEGRVGYCTFDKRVWSEGYGGKIYALAVYDRKLSSEEMIAFGLHRDMTAEYRTEDNQIELITHLLEHEKSWCEELKAQ